MITDKTTVDTRLSQRMGALPASTEFAIRRHRDQAFGAYALAESAVLSGPLALLMQLGEEWAVRGYEFNTSLEEMLQILQPAMPAEQRVRFLDDLHTRYLCDKREYLSGFSDQAPGSATYPDRAALRTFFQADVEVGLKLSFLLDSLDEHKDVTAM